NGEILCQFSSLCQLRSSFHEVDVPNFFLGLRDDADFTTALRNERLERAIGVMYQPETELMSHTFTRACPTSSTPSCITITLARSSCWSAQRNGRPGKLKKHFRVDSESVMSALKLYFLIQAVLAVPALAQTPSEQNSPLPSQAKQVHGLAVPVP